VSLLLLLLTICGWLWVFLPGMRPGHHTVAGQPPPRHAHLQTAAMPASTSCCCCCCACVLGCMFHLHVVRLSNVLRVLTIVMSSVDLAHDPASMHHGIVTLLLGHRCCCCCCSTTMFVTSAAHPVIRWLVLVCKGHIYSAAAAAA
jgi:hypothetical protein